jgi:hypothetical protein
MSPFVSFLHIIFRWLMAVMCDFFQLTADSFCYNTVHDELLWQDALGFDGSG